MCELLICTRVDVCQVPDRTVLQIILYSLLNWNQENGGKTNQTTDQMQMNVFSFLMEEK